METIETNNTWNILGTISGPQFISDGSNHFIKFKVKF